MYVLLNLTASPDNADHLGAKLAPGVEAGGTRPHMAPTVSSEGGGVKLPVARGPSRPGYAIQAHVHHNSKA